MNPFTVYCIMQADTWCAVFQGVACLLSLALLCIVYGVGLSSNTAAEFMSEFRKIKGWRLTAAAGLFGLLAFLAPNTKTLTAIMQLK